MIEVTVHHVVMYSHPDKDAPLSDQSQAPELGQSRVVLLKERAGNRTLPIRLTGAEGDALATLLAESSMPRSMPHDLIARLLEALEAQVEKVTVSTLHDNIYYATLWVRQNGKVSEVDARPSDALLLAQLMQAPIFVEPTALEQGRQTVQKPPAIEQARSPTTNGAGKFSSQRTAPGPRGHVLLGNLPEFRLSPLQFVMDVTRQYGDVVRFRIGPWTYHLISHPDHVKHILQDNNQNYRKGRIAGILESITGQSLLVSEGDFWRRQRRLAQPAFHRQRIAALVSIMTETAAPLLDRWQTYDKHGRPLNVWSEMQEFALSIVGRTLFNADLTSETDAVGRAATTMVEYLNYRFTQPLALPRHLPTPRNRRFQTAARRVDEVVSNIISERRRTGQDTGDLLSMLMQARDEETGEGMSDQQLRDEVLTFLFAGYETTASALMWTWYALSQYPPVEKRLREELAAALDGRIPTFEDLRSLPYTRMVLEESMRLYPPGWGFERCAIGDDEIGGYHIPTGSLLFLCPYVTHRHPAFWDTPEEFDPERFTSERSAGRPRYAYFPFGGGPRQCIGNEFAMMECQLVVAMVAQRYRLHLVPGHPVEPDALAATLRTRHGILMTLQYA